MLRNSKSTSEQESSEQELEWIRGRKPPLSENFLYAPFLQVKAKVSQVPPHTIFFIRRRTMEIVNEKDLKRFAVIDLFDIIFWDSDDVNECYDFYKTFGEENFKGIFDYKQNMYLDIVDIIDITGCQLHSE